MPASYQLYDVWQDTLSGKRIAVVFGNPPGPDYRLQIASHITFDQAQALVAVSGGGDAGQVRNLLPITDIPVQQPTGPVSALPVVPGMPGTAGPCILQDDSAGPPPAGYKALISFTTLAAAQAWLAAHPEYNCQAGAGVVLAS